MMRLLRVSPQAYRRNLDCIVAIEPHPNKQLAVKIQNLDIDALPSGQCTDDFLTLYDGRTNAAQFLAGMSPNILRYKCTLDNKHLLIGGGVGAGILIVLNKFSDPTPKNFFGEIYFCFHA